METRYLAETLFGIETFEELENAVDWAVDYADFDGSVVAIKQAGSAAFAFVVPSNWGGPGRVRVFENSAPAGTAERLAAAGFSLRKNC